MIAKGKIRAEGGKLARYLMTGEDGEIARLIETRGLDEFGQDPVQAFENLELWAQANTRCKLPFFHEQIRIAPNERLTDPQWLELVDASEKRLGFTGQPRMVSFHINPETGEKHLHAAWFRVDFENERAIDPGMFKNHLKELARKYERKFAIRELSNQRPPEHRARAADRNEFEQSRRLGTDINVIRTAILDCYQQSDSGMSFKAALETKGLMLANGDRRDCFVVIDEAGGHHALNKKLTGQTLAAVRERMADLDRSRLPGVEQAQAMQRARQVPERREPELDGPAAAHGPYTELRAAQTTGQFAAVAARATRERPATFDRDAADADWSEKLAAAAITKDEAARAEDTARQRQGRGRGTDDPSPAARGRYALLQTPETDLTAKPERELTGTAAEIRSAWALSRAGSDLEDALAARGISLAQVTPEEAYASERRAALAKEAGNFAPVWREGEIVAVDGRGHVHRLTRRTTGDSRAEIEGRLAGIDRAALMNVADTKGAMRAASRAAWKAERQAERERARPASAIEAAIAAALRDTMTGTDFAAELDTKGLTVARATAADVQALEALRVADLDAGTTGGLASGRRFADLIAGDFAAVTRQGDVFRLSPQKLDLEDIEQRLADVQTRLPGVVEARALFEINRERHVTERAQREADFIAGRLEDAEMFAGKQELRQTVHAGERAVHDAFDGSASAVGKGLRNAGRISGRMMKAFETAFSMVFGFAMAPPKLTPQQARDEAKARTNEESLQAQAYAAHVQAKDAEYDARHDQQKKTQQEQDLSLSARFGTPPTREANIGRERGEDYERERER